MPPVQAFGPGLEPDDSGHQPSDSPSSTSDSATSAGAGGAAPSYSEAADPAVSTGARIRGTERMVAAMEVVACSGVPTQLLIGQLLVGSGWAPAPTEGLTLALAAPLLLIDTVLVVAMMVFFTRRRGESVRRLWLGSRPRVREALIGTALIPLVFLMVVVLLNLLRLLAPSLRNVAVNPMEQMATQSLSDAVVFAFVAIVGGGVREELQRAFMLHRFERYLGGPAAAVIVLSSAFGLGHLQQGYDAGIITGALGAFWAVVYLRRRSVLVPVVSHAGFNAIEVLSVALLKT
jgi:membrane protease YdiL (CAAX protease family)